MVLFKIILFLCPAISLWGSSDLVVAQNIHVNEKDRDNNRLCSVGGSLAAAPWMQCAGLSDLSTALGRAWRETYKCIKCWNSPGRPMSLCLWHRWRTLFLCSTQLLLPAPLAASFTTYPRWGGRSFFGKQIYPLPATQLLRKVGMESCCTSEPRRWHKVVLLIVHRTLEKQILFYHGSKAVLQGWWLLIVWLLPPC